MENNKIEQLFVDKSSSIKSAMKVIDGGVLGIAFVVAKKNKFFGLVTDGDIRRAILSGKSINTPVVEIVNKNPILLRGQVKEKEIFALRNDERIRKRIPVNDSLKIPVLGKDGVVRDIVFIYDQAQKPFSFLKDRPKLHKEGIKRVLIVGGAGYLGSMLCRNLLAKGYKVRVLDNLTYGNEGIANLHKKAGFEFIKGDIRDISMVVEAIKGVEAVIHLAAIVGDPASSFNPEETIEINYLATKAIADACKFNQINKFLFASTCSVYGASSDPDSRLAENAAVNPVSLYAETKLKSEEGILSIADENFRPTIFRFATLFGSSYRMRFDLVVNLLTARALKEKEITIYQGHQWRPYLNVSDAALACSKWLRAPIDKVGSQIINVGYNTQNFQMDKIAEMIRGVVNDVKITHKDNSKDHRNYNVCFDKISKMLNFKPKKDIERGIRDIKQLIHEQKIGNFNHPKYNNYNLLSSAKG